MLRYDAYRAVNFRRIVVTAHSRTNERCFAVPENDYDGTSLGQKHVSDYKDEQVFVRLSRDSRH